MSAETIYELEDIIWLSRSLPLRHMMQPDTALHALRQQVEHLQGLPADGIATIDTPAESMIAADGYLHCLGAYNPDLRGDLLVRCGHPALVALGGMLCLLAPQPDDGAVLERSREGVGADAWLVGLAHRQATGQPAGDEAEHLALIHQIGARLTGLPVQRPRLWRTADVPRAEYDALQEEIRALYRTGGADEAHARMKALMHDKDSVLGQYLKDRSARRA